MVGIESSPRLLGQFGALLEQPRIQPVHWQRSWGGMERSSASPLPGVALTASSNAVPLATEVGPPEPRSVSLPPTQWGTTHRIGAVESAALPFVPSIKNHGEPEGDLVSPTATTIRRGVDVSTQVSLDGQRLGGEGGSESIGVLVAEVSSLASHKAEAQQLPSIRG